jgi:hypothetical protein
MSTMDIIKFVCMLCMWFYFLANFFVDTKNAEDEAKTNISMTPADKASLRACIRADFVGVVVCLVGIYLLGK